MTSIVYGVLVTADDVAHLPNPDGDVLAKYDSLVPDGVREFHCDFEHTTTTSYKGDHEAMLYGFELAELSFNYSGAMPIDGLQPTREMIAKIAEFKRSSPVLEKAMVGTFVYTNNGL